MTNTTLARYCITALLSLIINQVCFAAEHDSGRDLQLGSVAMDIPAEMVKRMTPLAKYLSQKVGITVNFRASPNLGSAVEDLGMNNTQIAYLTPVAYMEANEKFSAYPIVSPLSKGKPTFTLMIVVKNDSPIKSVSDLKGKKFAFGDKKATLQPAVVEEAGIRLEEFASYDYLNHYDNIAKAVLHGDFEAGIVKDTVAQKFAAEGLRVIHTSAPLPAYTFAVNKQLPQRTVNRIKNAMLALKESNPAHKEILNSLENGYTGFTAASDKDFEGIRKILGNYKARHQ